MQFNRHEHLEGLHAPFSASQSHWLRYDDEKAVETYTKTKAKQRGTVLHQWAQETINLGLKLPKSNKTLYRYVNDAIGFRMNTEVVLYYSPRFFGTADAICFNKGVLRIHDLKTGVTPASMEQLMVYAALFCLEYKIRPSEIEIELRIYQNNDVEGYCPTAEEIDNIIETIVHLDKVTSKID